MKYYPVSVFIPLSLSLLTLVRAKEATWYTPSGPDGKTPVPGACGQKNKNSDFVAALSPNEYANGAHCDEVIGVHYNDGYIEVTVKDLCPGCDEGHIDLSQGAFEQLGSLDLGVLHDITYGYVSGGSKTTVHPSNPTSVEAEKPASKGTANNHRQKANCKSKKRAHA